MLKGRMAKTSDPRIIVFSIVEAVLDKKVPLDEALETAFSRNPDLEVRDKALVKHLSTTLFRHLGAIDSAMGKMLKTPLPARAAWVRHWIRIGATQILFLNVPDHAAVNTTVNEISRAKRSGARVFKNLANAILRNFVRSQKDILGDLEKNPEKNLPPWLRIHWEKTLGAESLKKITAVLAVQPPLDVVLKNPKDAAALLHPLEAKEVFKGVLRLRPRGLIKALPGFKDGKWWAQDLAASLPARLFGDVKGKNVLDLCAAPGGKTLYLASRGAKVIAVDKSRPRLERLKENLARVGLEATIVCSDIFDFTAGKGFGAILLDAPCSATGTLRRHPDVAYLRKERDILRLAALQGRMLDHAFSLLRPGGVLVYSVCSLEASEGEDIIEAFLKANPSAQRQPVSARELDGHKEWITTDGDLRTLPCHLAEAGGMDGFYAARLVKSGDV